MPLISGTSGNDTLHGTIGDDIIDATQGGNDTIRGHEGNDTITAGDGYDDIDGGNGDDFIHAGAGQVDQISDGAGNDIVYGGGGIDYFQGFAGNDTYDGMAPGQVDDDYDEVNYYQALAGITVNLAAASNQARSRDADAAGIGVDQLTNIEGVEGGQFDDILTGNSGDNLLDGAGGNDVIDGAAGNDRLDGGGGDDTIRGGGGDDDISDDEGRDTIYGGDGDDRIFSGAGSDYVNCGAGADEIQAAADAADDSYDGGTGLAWERDILSYDRALAGIIVDLTAGSGHVRSVGDGDGAGIGIDTVANFEIVFGSRFGDTMTGDSGDNDLYGGEGNDRITDGAGSDHVCGGYGRDIIVASVGAGNDMYDGGENSDLSDDHDVVSYSLALAGVVVDLTAGSAQSVGGGDAAGIGVDFLLNAEDADGSAFNDHILGSAEDNNLRGLAGNDILSSGDGTDSIQSGDGDDLLDGGVGNDLLSGGNGNDIFQSTLTGLNGDTITDFAVGDRIVFSNASMGTFSFSLSGNLLTYGGGSLTLTGFAGHLQASAARDGGVQLAQATLVGTAGDDVLNGTDGSDIISGLGGNDQIDGGGGNDSLSGDEDTDFLRGGAGDDLLDGGAGGDRALYDDALAAVTVDLTAGIAKSTVGTAAGIGTDQLTNVEWVTGGAFDDVITGDAGFNILRGGAGNDAIDGGASDDALIGDEGDDSLIGGDGDDQLLGEAGSDTLNGGAGADELEGGDGNDVLDGGVDDDIMAGRAGNDLYVVDSWTDIVFEEGGEGVDGIRTPLSYTLGFEIENLRLTGSSAATGTGNELANSLTGNGAANALSGLAGNDILAGAAGADTLTGGAGADSFRDMAAGLNGDTITDFSAGDRIVISDADLAGFSFSLSGNTLTYTGGTLTLTGFTGQLKASAAAGGGVQLTVAPYDARNDFNGDGLSDILWRNEDGILTDWLGQANGSFVGNKAHIFTDVSDGWQTQGIGDFNGDGRDDILWRNSTGFVMDWLGQANGGFAGNAANLYTDVSDAWQVQGIGDFNGDGRDDILWRNANGIVMDWLGQANGGFASNTANLYIDVSDDWQVQGIGDFNGDGRDDILWRNNNGVVIDWLGQANGSFAGNAANLNTDVSDGWQVQGIGDFNGDGRDDILWRNNSGVVIDWLGQANGGFAGNAANLNIDVSDGWQVHGIGDYNGDGRDDILWRNSNGVVIDWLGQANGGFASNAANLNIDVSDDWHIQSPDLWV